MPLSPDKGIASLGKRVRKNRLLIGEEDIKNVLKPYNLQDALIELGWWSIRVHFYEPDHLIGKTAWQEPKAGVLITQHALAYLANLCLICRAGDYKEPRLSSNEDNVPVLCAIYNSLPDPFEFEEGTMPGEDRLQSFMLRSHYEQMALQFRPNYLIARTLLMFLNPFCEEVAKLNEVFFEVNGLSLYEYLRLAFVVFAALKEGPTFTKIKFTATDIPQLKVDLSDEAIESFLNILATDYACFLERDTEMNQDADRHFTKNRYNPLSEYPIIETDLQGIGRGYIVPNVVVYLLKAVGGLFWWFHNYYERQGDDPLVEFRTPFGKVFELYVGTILQSIYGEENVHGEILYGDGRRFIDWYVEEDNRCYLFEAKAYQFALASRRKGYKDAFIQTEVKKLMYAIKQVYLRVKDIEVYEELARFRGKEVIPIIVLLDVPYPSSRFFHEWVKEAQAELADNERIPELRDFKAYLMNVKELEFCDGITNRVAIEEVLEKAPENIQFGFEGILEEQLGRPLENRLLEATCSEFIDSILETD